MHWSLSNQYSIDKTYLQLNSLYELSAQVISQRTNVFFWIIQFYLVNIITLYKRRKMGSQTFLETSTKPRCLKYTSCSCFCKESCEYLCLVTVSRKVWPFIFLFVLSAVELPTQNVMKKKITNRSRFKLFSRKKIIFQVRIL